MINVFTEVGYMTQEMMEYLVVRIANKRSNGSLECALEAVQKSLKNDARFTLEWIAGSEKLMFALLLHIHDANEKIFFLALSLLVSVTSSNEDFPKLMAGVVG